MWLGDDGKGIIFVVEPEDPVAIQESVLAIDDGVYSRPELLSVRQLVQVRRGGVL